MDNGKKLNEIIKEYKDVISQFKKRSSTISGFGLAWKGGAEVATLDNTPFGVGDGLGTTGWCVSASQALLNDKVFQLLLTTRNSKAKLISIDIKEQFHGYCYNGSQNKWHTAILVEDNEMRFIIDITVRQFGNEFVDKDIWDLETWLYRLRSPLCKHNVTGFNGEQINVLPIDNQYKVIVNKQLLMNSSMDTLRNFTGLDEAERLFLTNFVVEKLHHINKHLLTNTVSKSEYNYLNDVTKHLVKLPFKKFNQGFAVLEFDTKISLINWLSKFGGDTGKDVIPMYLHFSDSVIDACNYSGIDYNDLNKMNKFKTSDMIHYLIIELNDYYGLQSFIPYTNALMPKGINLLLTDYESSIYNTGSLNEKGKLTNTIYLKADGVILPD